MGTMTLIGPKILISKSLTSETVFDASAYRPPVSTDRHREVKTNEDQCGRAYSFYSGGRIDSSASLVVLGLCAIGLRGLGQG